MNEAADPERSSDRSGNRLWKWPLALIGWAAATVVAFTLVAPFTGMGNLSGVLMVYVASVVGLGIIWCRLFRKSLIAFAGLPVAVIAPLVLMSAATHGLITYLNEYPPPRPMFHNLFAEHERSLLPYWHEELPIIDEHGNAVWSDYDDNTLVAVIDGAPDGSWTSPTTGYDRSQFAVRGRGNSNEEVVVERTENVLIVIAQDSRIRRFPLPQSAAREFHEKWRTRTPAAVLKELGLLLGREARGELRQFISDHHREGHPGR